MPIKPILLSLFFLGRLAIRGCERSSSFTSTHKASLGSEDLETLFSAGTFLGEGSFGRVHEIRWGAGTAAVKRVKKPSHPIEVKIQENEINFMQRMAGKLSVVDFYGCLETTYYLYLVQEKLYKDLDSSDVLLKIKNAKPADRLEIYSKIIKAFVVLHDKGIIHEDTKPGNIMTTSKQLDDFRIIDMGLSNDEGTQVLGGSPAFNGPEKIGNKFPRADPRHDIYALGITFAVIESNFNSVFSGVSDSCFTRVFVASCTTTLHRNIERILRAKSLEKLVPIIKKATSFEISDRYSSAASFEKEISLLINPLKPIKNSKLADADIQNLKNSRRPYKLPQNPEEQKKKDKGYLDNDAFYAEKGIFLQSIRANMYIGENMDKDKLAAQYKAVRGDVGRDVKKSVLSSRRKAPAARQADVFRPNAPEQKPDVFKPSPPEQKPAGYGGYAGIFEKKKTYGRNNYLNPYAIKDRRDEQRPPTAKQEAANNFKPETPGGQRKYEKYPLPKANNYLGPNYKPQPRVEEKPRPNIFQDRPKLEAPKEGLNLPVKSARKDIYKKSPARPVTGENNAEIQRKAGIGKKKQSVAGKIGHMGYPKGYDPFKRYV